MYHAYRTYNYSVRADGIGSKVNSVQLSRTDGNNTNNVDTETVSVLGTCGNPFGNGTSRSCPATSTFTGPEGKGIANTSVFESSCCVSLIAVPLVWLGLL
jgi:hypothetical protein